MRVVRIFALAAWFAWPVLADPPAEEATQATTATAEPSPEPCDLLTTDRLTGDWFGARPWLGDRGIDFNMSLTSVYQQNFHGGAQTHNGHRVTGGADYELTLDFEGLGLWKGGKIYTWVESGWNDAIDDRVGGLFGVNSDAMGDRSILVHELYYEHSFLDGQVRFKAGKIDLTCDIDTNAYANDGTLQFLNAALVNTGNIPGPSPGLAAVLVVKPVDWLYVGFAGADADADIRETGFRTAFHREDNFISGTEFGFLPTWKTPWGRLPGAYRFAVWHDGRSKPVYFDDLGGRRITIPRKRDDMGFYFNMDQLVLKENPRDDVDEQGLGFFFRYGYAHGDANLIEHFWSVGGQYQGLIPTRDDDVLGLGVAQGILSEDLRLTGELPHRETVLEMYYRISLTPWLSISPDFQWILDPGGVLTGTDAFVAGFRVRADF